MHIQSTPEPRERCIGDALTVAVFLCALTSMAKIHPVIESKMMIEAKINEGTLDCAAAAARVGAVEGRIS
jgi:hypothetical protein